ncbi:hypothetical protein GQ37_014470 [Janthinobacterium sp. BJB1]|uniref:hypothetical protein n=1 Tax=Janthinobacterium sp. GW458P TaxID=1981504 RepID=UPI000C0F719F|nr:hypothetical protein [Janthinobacterium sp. GW458P]MBE3026537.1 hypothetical protein [Janthinobacterium sp. GW458P]PHV16992.1 hypothetical protein CSQ90_11155 [Janthinobacterium sp. BJB303]PJC97724.1 hypothetical protein GQ37_014470 [Janthinobacterium sp. BJB1]
MHTSSPAATITTGQRGRILAYQASGQGCVSVAGTQHPFDVSTHWRSDTAPAINAVVDVRFDDAGSLATVTAIPAQQLAQEDMAGAAKLAREKSQQLWGRAVSALGIPVLGALGVLLAGAFIFNAIGIRLFASVSRTYWQLLGLSADSLESFARDGASGFTSAQLFFLLAIAGCCATMASSHPKAALGKCAPLLFIIVHSSLLLIKIKGAVSDAGNAMGGIMGSRAARMAEQMASEMLGQVWQGLSFGIGFYLVLAASIVLAAYGVGEYQRKTIG